MDTQHVSCPLSCQQQDVQPRTVNSQHTQPTLLRFNTQSFTVCSILHSTSNQPFHDTTDSRQLELRSTLGILSSPPAELNSNREVCLECVHGVLCPTMDYVTAHAGIPSLPSHGAPRAHRWGRRCVSLSIKPMVFLHPRFRSDANDHFATPSLTGWIMRTMFLSIVCRDPRRDCRV
ncbi:hypothetical protein GE21DRAFT_2671 [Neurospora crassa]|uniref:Uncharacterized protein n=1 Tax=Neurospora crassa (strain ATCC 24698 / 74-OR23-1A / CBS 708.71 / DSM 1257 / FGSC 987) TaxID=367110 RepID=V5IMX7_NEUCR|nr:hypothetical protein NCU16500 [Neurospora crassa OR74A]ESA43478.1 hypothetical protein NCU16500 [Neurospora crassa OR74A]KHE79792.1 hypothetical protein GE21DRAFT_2671 [Neurospora crassa]|eukprot:XP_011393664.1 hypothetical protein NCU16500 [Neurospora crassa OR74A]